jgi:hypothetical protein
MKALQTKYDAEKVVGSAWKSAEGPASPKPKARDEPNRSQQVIRLIPDLRFGLVCVLQAQQPAFQHFLGFKMLLIKPS